MTIRNATDYKGPAGEPAVPGDIPCAPGAPEGREGPTGRFAFRRAIPIVLLIAGLAAFFLADLDSLLSFETLRTHRATLTEAVAAHGFLAAIAFLLLYVTVVAFSLPGGALMTMTGGFLFGIAGGTALAVSGATLGATILFLAARTALGNALRSKAGPRLAKIEAGFHENAFSYLMILRLVPLFPFFLVNLAPAFLGISIRTYVVTTFFGIIPGTLVYASVGNGFGAIFDRGGVPDFGVIFEPQILIPILGLAFLATIPVIYRRLRDRGVIENIEA